EGRGAARRDEQRGENIVLLKGNAVELIAQTVTHGEVRQVLVGVLCERGYLPLAEAAGIVGRAQLLLVEELRLVFDALNAKETPDHVLQQGVVIDHGAGGKGGDAEIRKILEVGIRAGGEIIKAIGIDIVEFEAGLDGMAPADPGDRVTGGIGAAEALRAVAVAQKNAAEAGDAGHGEITPAAEGIGLRADAVDDVLTGAGEGQVDAVASETEVVGHVAMEDGGQMEREILNARMRLDAAQARKKILVMEIVVVEAIEGVPR